MHFTVSSQFLGRNMITTGQLDEFRVRKRLPIVVRGNRQSYTPIGT